MLLCYTNIRNHDVLADKYSVGDIEYEIRPWRLISLDSQFYFYYGFRLLLKTGK